MAACRQSRNPYLYAIVVLALGTGGRKNEIRFLRWPAVDFHAGVVRFVQTKTHLDRAVPLLGEARTVLEQLARRRAPEVPWVFAPDGRGPVWVDTSWYTALRHTGITNLHFHDLRHTFASYVAMSGGSLRDIAHLLGHRTIQMSMTYTYLLQTHKADVVARMTDKCLRPATEEPPHAW